MGFLYIAIAIAIAIGGRYRLLGFLFIAIAIAIKKNPKVGKPKGR